MPYLIDTYDREHTQALRQALRDEHLDYLEEKKSMLLACGAKLDDEGIKGSGSLYIVDVETRQEAEDFINGDPFTKGGLFERIEIKRWRKAYLNGESFL